MDKAIEQEMLLAGMMRYENRSITRNAPLCSRRWAQLGDKTAKWVTQSVFIEDVDDIEVERDSWHDDVSNYCTNSADI